MHKLTGWALALTLGVGILVGGTATAGVTNPRGCPPPPRNDTTWYYTTVNMGYGPQCMIVNY